MRAKSSQGTAVARSKNWYTTPAEEPTAGRGRGTKWVRRLQVLKNVLLSLSKASRIKLQALLALLQPRSAAEVRRCLVGGGAWGVVYASLRAKIPTVKLIKRCELTQRLL